MCYQASVLAIEKYPESEYTYYTEMLYEKPMWFWNIEQYKSILVDLNNGIMISRNGHDMGPLMSGMPTSVAEWENLKVYQALCIKSPMYNLY